MLTPYIMYIKVAASIALIAGLFFAGHHQGAKAVQAKWDADKALRQKAQMNAVQIRIDENERKLAKQQEFHALEIKQYEESINALKSNVAKNRAAILSGGGLRLPTSACPRPATSTAPADAGSSYGADGQTFRIPAEFEKNLLDLAERADTETGELEAKVQMCQQFAKDNGFAP